MQRRSDWQAALDEFVRTHQNRPFEYGNWGCCLFVCDVCVAMTCVDLAASYRGKYSTRAGALHAIGEPLGTASIQAVAANAAAAHHMPEVPVPYAHRGDMVLEFVNFLAAMSENGQHTVVARPKLNMCTSIPRPVSAP